MSSPVPLPVDVQPIDSRPSAPAQLRTLSFARGLWRIAAADASAGNRGGADARWQRLRRDDRRDRRGARQRRARVLHCDSDSVGERFADALIAAAARGVRVRLIADWVGSRDDRRARTGEALREGGVDVRIFNLPGFRAVARPRAARPSQAARGRRARWRSPAASGSREAWSGGREAAAARAPWRDTAVRIAVPRRVDMVARVRVHVAARELRGAPRWRAATLVRRARNSDTRARGHRRAPWSASSRASRGACASRARCRSSPSSAREVHLDRERVLLSVERGDRGAVRRRADGVDVRVLVPSKYDHPVGAHAHAPRVPAAAAQRRAHLGVERHDDAREDERRSTAAGSAWAPPTSTRSASRSTTSSTR